VSEPTLYRFEGAVATITLNDPERRNALSPALVNSLGDHLAAAAIDPACRAVVITNAGPAFCSGADLKAGAASGSAPEGVGEGPPGSAPEGVGEGPPGSAPEGPRYGLAELLTAILDHPKPVVGKIAGHCMGGGVGLAAACDISVAAADARFGFTEVRVGVAPAVISVVCLAKLRTADALQLFLTGEQIQAGRAAEVGLVNLAVPREELDSSVTHLLDMLLEGGPAALASAKRLVRQVPSMSRADAFAWTSRLSAELFASPEAAEGMAAFRERRRPSWAPQGPGDQ
jgi:methylglutaconyl-CoA hydratase